MLQRKLKTDLAVIGGGMAGLVAAIAAARLGTKVVLVQDRPVLGGNASSEVRVWVSGAQGHTLNRFAREGGILNELLMEQLYRNPECSPPVWNAVLLDAVLAEPRITLLLDTAVHRVTMGDPGRIESVSAYCSPSETAYRISAPLFVDASGDSVVGGLAGADFRVGKESREAFGEPTAPPRADPRCLGASLYFYTRDAGRPVPFVRPDFAADVTRSPRVRSQAFDGRTQGCRLWWIEFGGELDTITDSGRIKATLTAIVYGFWDYIKNSGKFPEARNLDLAWVGPTPGKRESRRLMGPHVLAEHDLFRQPDFPDSCATGGWTIDHHPPKGFFSRRAPSRHKALPGPYNIPLRCLFSRNVENLFMAGRNISTSNVAFGSTRVMGTGAACGQAVGTAAALCLRERLTPAELVEDADRVQRLRQTLVREDQHVYHTPNRDPGDLARTATAEASGELALAEARPARSAETTVLEEDHWLMLPVVTPRLDRLDLFADVARATTLTVEVRRNDRGCHYFPNQLVAERRIRLRRGRGQWIRVPLDLETGEPGNVWFVVKRNPRVALHGSRRRITGVLSSLGSRRPWPEPRQDLFAFRLRPVQPVYPASAVVNGFARPEGLPNLWVSRARVTGRGAKPPWIELRWDERRTVGHIRLYLSHDPDMQIPTMMMRYPFRAVPTVLKHFTLSVRVGGGWKPVARIRGNHRRLVCVDLAEPVRTDRLRLRAEATNGSPRAEVYEIRAYRRRPAGLVSRG